MSEISRRTAIAWMLAASANIGLGGYRIASALPAVAAGAAAGAAGYGTDPNLMKPVVPWPLILSPAQRETVRVAADLIIPADERSPSAGALHMDVFVDEWVSAPYPRQQDDAKIVLPGLAWLDEESARRFGKAFVQASDAQRRAIFDDIAWAERIKPGLEKHAVFFGKLRQLVTAGFYTRPEGAADLGYKGNTAILGDYPGPTSEALAHLRTQLAKLGLPEPG